MLSNIIKNTTEIQYSNQTLKKSNIKVKQSSKRQISSSINCVVIRIVCLIDSMPESRNLLCLDLPVTNKA